MSCISAMTAMLCFVGIARAEPSAATLKEAAGSRLLIGTAVSEGDLRKPDLAKLIAAQFGCMTAGNEMKPDALQRVKGQFTFDRADRIIEFAEANKLQIIGHTLLWHEQTPKWLFQDQQGKPLPREEALENLRTHIHMVVTHFKGKVKGWDVVNEAIADGGPSDLRDTPARRAIGDDYVLKAFEFAREADPNVELYYNDYNIERDYKRERALRLVKSIRAAGLKIDAVGVQGHWLLGSPETAEIERGIRAFTDAGFDVMITEMDVDPLPRNKGATADLSATEREGIDPYKTGLPEDLQRQLAERYRELFQVILANPKVRRVTLWGTTDANTWLNDWPVRGRTNHPMLFDRQYRPKPAAEAVLQVLQATSTRDAKAN